MALGHAPGRYTLAAIDAAIGRLVRDGELIEVERRGMDRAFVTDRAVRAERRVLAAMRAGRGKGMALANGETVEKQLDGTRLTKGQKEAVRTVLLADDLVIGVQGDAGSSKTTMLREVKVLLGERRIHGLAPSAAAARVLERETGIPSRTLQYFLTRFGNLSDEEGLARARKEYAGAVLAVVGTEEGMVILAHPDGKERRFRPSGNAAWYLRICDTERIELRAGDRIRWTRNHKVPPRSFGQTGAPDLVNGGEAEIVDIDYRRVRFRDGEGREFNLALTNPQLRHLDHAYCSTVHAAQGRTARAAIAILDAGGAADRELFHVELSRVSDRFLLLTDDREALVELLEARAVTEDGALEALGVDPAKIPAVDLEVFEVLTEDWKALRRQAEETATIPFFLPGYGGVMARAAALSTIEDLPADMRRLTDTMLAEHKEHLARDREVRNLTGRIQESWRRWPELGWAASAQGQPIEELPQYDAWRKEGAALLEAARTLLEADGDAARHLHGMPGGRAGLKGAVETLERTRLRNEAVLGFEARLQEVNVRAKGAGTIPYYARGHGVLLEQARALVLLPHLPSRYAAAAERVVADARACESLCPEIVALRGEMAGLLDERFTLENLAAGEPLVELGDYAAWWNRCEAAKRSWQGMLGDPDTWRPHLGRLGEEAAAIESVLDRLAKLRGHDLFDASIKRIAETAQAACGRGILPFHDDAHRDAVDEAKRLAGKHELDEEAQQRLQAVLEEQAARAAEWMVVVKLLRAMGRLERRSLQLEIDAEQGEVPRTELSGWEKLQERIRRFTEDARAALDDEMLQAHWESRPDIRASIEKGLLD